jgi:sphingolipid delta-4 desaturase
VLSPLSARGRQHLLNSFHKVTKLMGHEPLTKYVALSVVLLQLLTAYLLRNTSPLSLPFILLAYVVGGTANQHLFLAIHEITHNVCISSPLFPLLSELRADPGAGLIQLAFRSIKANKILAIVTNFPIALPYAMLFKVDQ